MLDANLLKHLDFEHFTDCDGDSASYRAVLDANPCGEGVEVTKKECMGHNQKKNSF